MLEWLAKLSGAKKPPKNPKNVPPELLELLAEDLASLDKLKKGIGEELFRYVVDDEGEEVLLTLSGLEGAAEALGVVLHIIAQPDFEKKASKARQALFRKFDRLDPEVAYRLARVLHAAYGTMPTKPFTFVHLPKEMKWLETLLPEALLLGGWGVMAEDSRLSVAHLVSVMEAAGHDSGALAEWVFLRSAGAGLMDYARRSLPAFVGLKEYLAAQPGAVAKALADGNAWQRAEIFKFLHDVATPMRGEMVRVALDEAIGAAKSVRANAEAWLMAQAPEAKREIAEQLRARAEQGGVAERARCVELLFHLQGEACRTFLEERREVEKAGSVVRQIEKYLEVHEAQSRSEDADSDGAFAIPEPKTYASEWKMPPEVERDLLETFERYNAKAIEAHAKWWDRMPPKWRQGGRIIAPPTAPKEVKLVCKAMENSEQVSKQTLVPEKLASQNILYRELAEFIARHDLDLVPMIRLGCCVGIVQKTERAPGYYGASYVQDAFIEWLNQYRLRKDPGMTLLDLGSAFRAAGLSEAWVEQMYVSPGYMERMNPLGLSDEAIWPFFYKYPKALEEALGIGGQSASVPVYRLAEYRKKAYRILAGFPRPPRQFATFLWEQALGTAKSERAFAQECLKNFPGRETLIINALSDGRKEVRANAANWLGELKVVEAAGPVRQALAKEKHDEVKAALMEALETFGEDIDKFLNRKKLLDEAQKGLEKGIHSDLAWFPFDRLPEMHWEKNKQQVPPEIIKWFIVQSFRLKSPEPGPLLRRYFALMRPDERRVLGRFVLDSWLTQDTLPRYNREEAEKLADQRVAQFKQYAVQYPQYYQNFDETQTRNAAVNEFLTQCLGSANSSKGILAVAAACCGVDAVAPVERYLKQWYGMRMAQCKALIQMLSWVEHPMAIQLILSVATRFRTKGIQKEAAAYADLIAERKEWTRDEMADRTIPTAGFERDGTQIIDYGQRQFTARLLEDFSIQLETSDGKVIKDLPSANKLEDEAEVKALKTAFAASKKELKQVLKFQQERLYEAMCAQRRWRYEDWDLYLNGHPIVGRYCQRLVWLALRGKEIVASFRPLGDGTLTDSNDEEVKLEPNDEIQIAHQAFLSEEGGARWVQSLKDYEVQPLFEQFGGKRFTLDEEAGKQTAITEFEGYLVGSFRLRGRANKLGYTRGQAEDAGWFYTYHKNFPTLKLQAVIEFTGNVLPEEDRTVALRSLHFTRLHDTAEDNYGSGQRALCLSEVPEVLVSESWNDMKKMADDGTGFDPDWEKKSEF